MSIDDFVKNYILSQLDPKSRINILINIIIKTNEKVVKTTAGENHLVTNLQNLESAVNRVQWYGSREEIAACLLQGLVQNHGFEQGNKRTASAIASSILGRLIRINEYQVAKKIKKWEIKKIAKLI